jgi:transposase
MAGSILTPVDRVHLLRMMRRHTPSPVHRRMNALLLLDDGWAAERVADVLFIDAETVREHRRLYQTAGVPGLELLNYEGSDPALSDVQLKALETELDTHLYMTTKEVCDFIRRTFGVDYTPNAMTKLLKWLDYVYKKPKCVPAKADAAVQERFATETLLPHGAGECRPSAVFRGRLHGPSGIRLDQARCYARVEEQSWQRQREHQRGAELAGPGGGASRG